MSTRSDDRRQNPSHLTGPRKSALYDYKSDLKDAIAPVLVDLPPTALSRDAVAQSMHAMSDKGASGKTVANRYGFLSSALNAAVKAGRIPSNPAFEPALHPVAVLGRAWPPRYLGALADQTPLVLSLTGLVASTRRPRGGFQTIP